MKSKHSGIHLCKTCGIPDFGITGATGSIKVAFEDVDQEAPPGGISQTCDTIHPIAGCSSNSIQI